MTIIVINSSSWNIEIIHDQMIIITRCITWIRCFLPADVFAIRGIKYIAYRSWYVFPLPVCRMRQLKRARLCVYLQLPYHTTGYSTRYPWYPESCGNFASSSCTNSQHRQIFPDSAAVKKSKKYETFNGSRAKRSYITRKQNEREVHEWQNKQTRLVSIFRLNQNKAKYI